MEVVAQGCSLKKVFLKISQNSQENTRARVFFNKEVAGLRCFPLNFVKFLETPCFIEHLRWLLFFSYRLHIYENHVIFLVLTLQISFVANW